MHPVIVEVAGIPIYSYGVMLGTSMIVAWYLVMHIGSTREGMPKDQMANAFIVTAIVAIVCSRILYIITNPDEFTDAFKLIDLRSGGLVAYGGFLGGLLGSWLYWRRKEHSLLAWADVVAPTLGLGLGFTRIGCYLFGCDFGAVLADDAPGLLRDWGTFPGDGAGLNGEGSPAFQHHVANYGLSEHAHYSLPVHPTQLYESVFGFALFGVAMLVWWKRRFRGQVILTVTALYAVWRFFIEYVRDDPERGELFGFSTSQLISLALLPLVGFLFFQLWKNRGATAPALATAGAPSSADDDEPKPKGPPKKKKKRKR